MSRARATSSRWASGSASRRRVGLLLAAGLWAVSPLGPAAGAEGALDLETLDGSPARIRLEGPSRPLVLHFWATWCPRCVEELPDLDRLVRTTCPGTVRVIAVNVEDDLEDLHALVGSTGITLEVLRDPDGAAFRRWFRRGLPANLIATSEGISTRDGSLSAGEWRELLGGVGCVGSTD